MTTPTEQPDTMADTPNTVDVLHLRRILAQPHPRVDERELHIVIHSPGNVGGTPSVKVEQVFLGFDWDGKKLLIYPQKPLTVLTPEQVGEITQSVRDGQSWHAFEQYKKHRQQISVLNETISRQAACLKTLLNDDNLTDEQRRAINAALNSGENNTSPGKT